MRIDAGMDTAKCCCAANCDSPARDTPELAAAWRDFRAADAETLRGCATVPLSQSANHAEASTAPLLKKEDGRINWSLTAGEISTACAALRHGQARSPFFAAPPASFCRAVSDQVQVQRRRMFTPESLGRCPKRGPPSLPRRRDVRRVRRGKTLLRVCPASNWKGAKRSLAQEFFNGAHLHDGEHFD